MQEEVENRTLTLVVNGTKFTGRLFKAAICKYLAHRKEKKLNKQRSRDAPVKPHGKQTVKQLIGQNQGVSNIEITDPSIKEFEKIARKYGVDYAVKKDRSSSPPKYLIFFKGRDADALTAAFTEYTGKQTVKQLIGQNQGVSNIEITDPSIKEFEKIARKYGVDYAVKKDRSCSPPKYLIFFKGRDADALTSAFTEYTNKKVKKVEKSERPSVLAKLSQFKELVKNAVVDRTKRKELER